MRRDPWAESAWIDQQVDMLRDEQAVEEYERSRDERDNNSA